MNTSTRARGFTIVELLIVIVVIGILAAITIVAFNGIQQRARVATVKADLSSASKQLELANLNDGAYPADSSSLKASTGTTYQYAFNASANTYCLTATNGTSTYKVSSTATTPTEGGCAGHGVGGVAAITNLVTNPSFEASTSTGGGNISTSGGTQSFVTEAGGPAGNVFRRGTYSGAASTGWGQYTGSVPVGTYTASVWVRSNQALNFFVYTQGSSTRTIVSRTPAAYPTTLTPNTWTRFSTVINVTAAGSVQVGGYVNNLATGGYLDMDGVMLTEGSALPGYADGSTPNWIWNGAANASTSTGPAA